MDGEAAAQRLRGRVGTTVKVKVLDVCTHPLLQFEVLFRVFDILQLQPRDFILSFKRKHVHILLLYFLF